MELLEPLKRSGAVRRSYSFTFRSRSALEMTDTELNVMAALATIGLRRMPKNG